MEFTLRRLLEVDIIARRGDAAWIRSALRQDRHDLTGRIEAVEPGGVMVDSEQRWAANVFGRFTLDGNHRPGSRLVMITGGAAGSDWELLSAVGSRMTVVGDTGNPIDLAAAGVAPGDAYEIRVDQHERAVSWFSKTAIRVILGYAQDPSVFPCYTLSLASSSEQGRPVGNYARTVGAGAGGGPVFTQEVGLWQVSFQIEAWALTPDECVWMYRVLEYAYRGWIRYLERIFQERLNAQGSDVRVEQGVPHGIFVRSFTIGGIIEKTRDREVAWLADDDNPPRSNADVRRLRWER